MRYQPHVDGVKVDPDAVSDTNERGHTITPLEAMIDHGSTKKLHAMAEMAEQQTEERIKRHSEPIRMAGLKPLPPDVPRLGPGQIPAGPDALGMTPSVRRSIPEPFQRSRIAIDHHGKTWAYARADSVAKGDILVDFGRVEIAVTQGKREVIAGHSVLTGEVIILVNPENKVRECGLEDQLYVFRVHDPE